MRKIVSLALLALALGLGGCATTNQYGNFVQSAALDQQRLATDAVQQLATLYAPARTRLELQQPTPDPFGQALVKSLRDGSYHPPGVRPGRRFHARPRPRRHRRRAHKPPRPRSNGLPLRYVLDQAGDSNLYRLTLMVGNQSITRPYLAQNGTFAPAGALGAQGDAMTENADQMAPDLRLAKCPRSGRPSRQQHAHVHPRRPAVVRAGHGPGRGGSRGQAERAGRTAPRKAGNV